MRDITSRSNVFEKFRKEPEFFLKTAKQEGIPLSEVFRIEAPVADKGDHEDPLLDMIQKSGLRIESNRNYPSSTLGDFTRSDYGHFLLFDWLDRCYENTLLGTRAADSGSTGIDETNYLAGQVYRPYMERPITQRKMIAPQVRIGDIVSRVETVTEDLIRQPEYTTGGSTDTTYIGPVSTAASSEEQMIAIAPGGRIPTTIISLGSRTAELKKVGIGVAVTDEFNSNNIRVSAVQTWVERVAVNHEIAIVEEGVNTIKSGTRAGVNNQDIPLSQQTVTGGLEGIVTVNTWFEEPYMLDLLIARKDDAIDWITLNVQAGGMGAQFLQYPGGRFSDVFSAISLVNRNNQPTRLAYLRNGTSGNPAGHGLAANDMLGIDSRVTLVMYRHARGSVNERERIASQQIEARYMTERYAFMIEDPNSRVLFGI